MAWENFKGFESNYLSMTANLVTHGQYHIKIEELRPEDMKPKYTDESALGFGQLFTDRMFLQEYKNGQWQEAVIKKYEPFVLDPSVAVFHYAQEIFEGLKAYRHPDGSVALFRPEKNAERFRQSARRMAMPEVDPEFFVFAIDRLVALEKDWIPRSKGTSMYVRPTMIATEAALGVHPSDSYYFYIILSPSGPYFKSGFNPVKIYVTKEYTRAAPGGTGAVKAGGNYAASLIANLDAKKYGASQVLWLDAKEHKYVEEVGAMNMMFVIDDTVITSPLTGTILPGVTRDSILQLAPHLGYKAEERRISIDEVVEAIESGSLTEAFGCGTAAVVTPVGSLYYEGKEYVINDGKVGSITKQLYDELTAIQYGEKEDPFGWVHKVED